MGEADGERVADGDMGLRTAAFNPEQHPSCPPSPPGSLRFGAFAMGTALHPSGHIHTIPCSLPAHLTDLVKGDEIVVGSV